MPHRARHFHRCALTLLPSRGPKPTTAPARRPPRSPRFFGIPATDTDIISAQHFWTGGLETAGPGCYDAVAIARAAGFRMLVMSRTASVMRRLSFNHSEPAKKSGQNILKNRCRTTIAEADSGNAIGTALYRGSGRLLKPRPGRPDLQNAERNNRAQPFPARPSVRSLQPR